MKVQLTENQVSPKESKSAFFGSCRLIEQPPIKLYLCLNCEHAKGFFASTDIPFFLVVCEKSFKQTKFNSVLNKCIFY